MEVDLLDLDHCVWGSLRVVFGRHEGDVCAEDFESEDEGTREEV